VIQTTDRKPTDILNDALAGLYAELAKLDKGYVLDETGTTHYIKHTSSDGIRISTRCGRRFGYNNIKFSVEDYKLSRWHTDLGRRVVAKKPETIHKAVMARLNQEEHERDTQREADERHEKLLGLVVDMVDKGTAKDITRHNSRGSAVEVRYNNGLRVVYGLDRDGGVCVNSYNTDWMRIDKEKMVKFLLTIPQTKD